MLTKNSGRLKELRKLSRRSVRTERRLFLAEGRNALEAAVDAGCAVEVFARSATHYLFPENLGDTPVTWVDERALDSLSESKSHGGLVTLCRQVDVPMSEAFDGARLVAICAAVRDPGNAGTVIRCADAAGADAVVLTGGSVDAYNPKTIRASAGSLFHLPIAVEPSVEAAVAAAKDAGLTVLGADGEGEVGLYDVRLDRPTAWLFGNEAWGLPPAHAALADHLVAIPIHGRAESLNLATAAALCLYESARAAHGRG